MPISTAVQGSMPDWTQITDPAELAKAKGAFESGVPVLINDIKYNVPVDTTTYPRQDATVQPYLPPAVTPTAPAIPVVDEAALRAQEEARIAAQIKAIEGVYAGEIAKARQAGGERVKQRTAISTVRGGAGSDFAAAEKDVVEQANADIESAINASMRAEIAAARSKGGENAQKAIEAAYANAEKKKAMADTYIQEEKNKFAEAENLASKLSQSGGTYEALDPVTRGLLEKYYGGVENAKKIFTKLGVQTSEQTKAVEVGGSLVNPITGEVIYKGTGAIDSKVIGNDSSGYYEKQSDGTWKQIVGASQGSANQKIVKIDGVDYVQNADGSYTKPVVPTSTTVSYGDERKQLALNKIDDLVNDVNRLTSGFIGQTLSKIGGTDAFDLKAKLTALGSNLAFSELQAMRDASKTGGALGQVSERELALLEGALGSLNIGQSKEQLLSQLNQIKSSINNFSNAVKQNTSTGTTTRMIGPDGIQYNVPNDQVDAFIQDGGRRFSNVGGDTNKAIAAAKTVEKAQSVVEDTKGGQCGTFVRKVAGVRVGDSYQSKLAVTDPSITYPEPGMVFVMPTGGETKENGHIGIILSIKDGIATVRDSNWKGNEIVTTHQIPISKMTGFTYPKIS